MLKAFQSNWRLYLIEAWALGMFMVSATFFVVVFYHPIFSFNTAIQDPFFKRFLIGLAMGLTAVALIESGWGKKSGAHMNPSVTLAQLQLGRLAKEDAYWYILFQTIGATIPMVFGRLFFNNYLAYPAVDYIVTKPGPQGIWVAFIAEAGISFLLLITLLVVSNSKLNKFTSLAAGGLVCAFITLEAPLSGMSINPARSFGSAIAAQEWDSFWIYIMAPIGGMQIAAYVFQLAKNRYSAMLTP
jgi:aquaporin Z